MKVTILDVVKYLVAEGYVSRSAYLEYAYLKGESLFLHWYDNEPKDINVSEGCRKFNVKIDGHNRYYVHISRDYVTCTVYDHGNKYFDNYIYYASYENQEIVVCGYYYQEKHYVKKAFENGMMTEYSYEMKKGKFSSKSKKKVYEGDYEYNPKLHFPRKKKENEGQRNQEDKKAKLNANTKDQKSSRLNTIVK